MLPGGPGRTQQSCPCAAPACWLPACRCLCLYCRRPCPCPPAADHAPAAALAAQAAGGLREVTSARAAAKPPAHAAAALAAAPVCLHECERGVTLSCTQNACGFTPAKRRVAVRSAIHDLKCPLTHPVVQLQALQPCESLQPRQTAACHAQHSVQLRGQAEACGGLAVIARSFSRWRCSPPVPERNYAHGRTTMHVACHADYAQPT